MAVDLRIQRLTSTKFGRLNSTVNIIPIRIKFMLVPIYNGKVTVRGWNDHRLALHKDCTCCWLLLYNSLSISSLSIS